MDHQALLLIEVNVAVKRKALADVSMLGMVTATLGRPLGWALGFMYFCFRCDRWWRRRRALTPTSPPFPALTTQAQCSGLVRRLCVSPPAPSVLELCGHLSKRLLTAWVGRRRQSVHSQSQRSLSACTQPSARSGGACGYD